MASRLAVGPVPLYHQLETDLMERIASGEFGPGATLPTEEAIGAAYGVSRITVRKALDSLFQAGRIVRRRGVGSFVAKSAQDVHSIQLSGSLDEFLATAGKLNSTVIRLDEIVADAELAALFDDDAGAALTRLELVSSDKDGPLAHFYFYFPSGLGRHIGIDDVSGSEPVVRVLERKAGIRVVRATQVIEPAIVGSRTAALLGLAEGTPVLNALRTYFDSTGAAIEIVKVHYHPQRYRYAVELRTRPYSV